MGLHQGLNENNEKKPIIFTSKKELIVNAFLNFQSER